MEAGVKYVKQDCFYGEHFTSQQAVRDHLQHWLDEVANRRVHGTTGSFDRPSAVETRRADKTGLIGYRANKYSVPLAWQQAQGNRSPHTRQLKPHLSDMS